MGTKEFIGFAVAIEGAEGRGIRRWVRLEGKGGERGGGGLE